MESTCLFSLKWNISICNRCEEVGGCQSIMDQYAFQMAWKKESFVQKNTTIAFVDTILLLLCMWIYLKFWVPLTSCFKLHSICNLFVGPCNVFATDAKGDRIVGLCSQFQRGRGLGFLEIGSEQQ